MKKLLQLKHWQLFILLAGIPIIAQFSFMGYIFSWLLTENIPMPADEPMVIFDFFSVFMKGMCVITTITMLLHFSWQYTLGTNLYKRLPEGTSMNLPLFKAFMIFPLLYVPCFMFYMASMVEGFKTLTFPNPFVIMLMIPLHLFSIFCMFYCIYFNAKSLKAVEKQKPVKGDEYIAEFFLLCFFVVGVWILQPRINKLFTEKEQ